MTRPLPVFRTAAIPAAKFTQPSGRPGRLRQCRGPASLAYAAAKPGHTRHNAMLRHCRIILAVISLVLMTALFLDFTATVHPYAGFLAKLQFVPALLAASLAVLVLLVLVTLLFGRVYCSILCPLGIFQDLAGCLARRRTKQRFSFARAHTAIRVAFLAIFVLACVPGAGTLVALLDPYASFGRMMTALVQPLIAAANNGLSLLAEHLGSYAFAPVEVTILSVPLAAIALGTLVLVSALAARYGRLYCNSVCPVGTLLGLLSRHALFRPRFTRARCTGCRRCERSCKSSCLDLKHKHIDLSRCVACMNCVAACPAGALTFGRAGVTTSGAQPGDGSAATRSATRPAASSAVRSGTQDRAKASVSRRAFLKTSPLAVMAAPAATTGKLTDGGLAVIADKVNPKRTTALVPPGAESLRHFARHCTGCQLCVAVCPNHVLRAAHGLVTLMQPQMGFEHGYCRPECTRCGEVCPTGAILPVTRAQKSALQIGRAVWTRELCIAISRKHSCDNCAQHCPVQAITMVPLDSADPASLKIPAINDARCTGCGACEHLCPSRPVSAIHVEGILVHAEI